MSDTLSFLAGKNNAISPGVSYSNGVHEDCSCVFSFENKLESIQTGVEHTCHLIYSGGEQNVNDESNSFHQSSDYLNSLQHSSNVHNKYSLPLSSSTSSNHSATCSNQHMAKSTSQLSSRQSKQAPHLKRPNGQHSDVGPEKNISHPGQAEVGLTKTPSNGDSFLLQFQHEPSYFSEKYLTKLLDKLQQKLNNEYPKYRSIVNQWFNGKLSSELCFEQVRAYLNTNDTLEAHHMVMKAIDNIKRATSKDNTATSLLSTSSDNNLSQLGVVGSTKKSLHTQLGEPFIRKSSNRIMSCLSGKKQPRLGRQIFSEDEDEQPSNTKNDAPSQRMKQDRSKHKKAHHPKGKKKRKHKNSENEKEEQHSSSMFQVKNTGPNKIKIVRHQGDFSIASTLTHSEDSFKPTRSSVERAIKAKAPSTLTKSKLSLMTPRGSFDQTNSAKLKGLHSIKISIPSMEKLKSRLVNTGFLNILKEESKEKPRKVIIYEPPKELNIPCVKPVHSSRLSLGLSVHPPAEATSGQLSQGERKMETGQSTDLALLPHQRITKPDVCLDFSDQTKLADELKQSDPLVKQPSLPNAENIALVERQQVQARPLPLGGNAWAIVPPTPLERVLAGSNQMVSFRRRIEQIASQCEVMAIDPRVVSVFYLAMTNWIKELLIKIMATDSSAVLGQSNSTQHCLVAEQQQQPQVSQTDSQLTFSSGDEAKYDGYNWSNIRTLGHRPPSGVLYQPEQRPPLHRNRITLQRMLNLCIHNEQTCPVNNFWSIEAIRVMAAISNEQNDG